MKLAAAGVLLLATAPAVAETSFVEYSNTVPSRPTQQLFEAACDLDIQLRGAVATVEVRQRIVNPGPDAFGGSYGFDLPRGATLTGFSLRTKGGADQAIVIPGAFSSVDIDARPALGADPALLIALPEGAPSQYAIRLQPIAPDHDVVMTTKFSTLAEIRAGAMRLVLPARTGTGKLTACRGSVRASAGPGAAIGRVVVGGVEAGTRGTATFVLDTKDLAIDAALELKGRDPVVWTQTQPLADGWSATLVTVAAPAMRTASARHRRALFVIDGSRSMELVGRHNVTKVIRTVAAALPAGTEVEAIIYDRTAKRVLGRFQPGTPDAITAIETAVTRRGATNGSDLVGAYKLVHTAITDGKRDSTIVVTISDGVLGDVAGTQLAAALDTQGSAVDVLAVVLDPARTNSPGAQAMQAPVSRYGGSFIEVNVDQLDTALTVVDEWLRPSWMDLAIGGDLEAPPSVRAGAGFTRLAIHRGAASKFVLTGQSGAPIKIAPRSLGGAPVATLALRAYDGITWGTSNDPTDKELEAAARLRRRAASAHPYAAKDVAFAVLTTQGKIARSRIATVKGGGGYERITEVEDPFEAITFPPPTITTVVPSAIAKVTIERLFREQLQPKAYACYQRALGTAPKLAGTAHFELLLGRGEITEVKLMGLGNAGLDACLLDAAYQLEIPLPDFSINADDQTLARYPLTFSIAENKPVIVSGDADSSSPIDIDAVEGGVPARGATIKVDAATPLGKMRPAK